METLRVDIQNDQEKKVLLAFLDSLNYQYSIDKDIDVTTPPLKDLDERKADLLSGKTSSLPWDEGKS
ncbi:hypothetical protein [Mucilaginibacter lappiensis]|jgi:hypothetical protein|uniref:hypothetical protein n=1 Tax=Mucilaginibacter lappiensis TaxID=354630 RepID=UPI003D203FEF